jgi:hypothetical protein
MNRYTILEMAIFAIVAAVLFSAFPENMLAVYGAAIGTYFLLQLASAIAFCVAIHKGLVREHGPAPYRYSVKPACEKDWLVMRHIWSYLRTA